MVRCGATAVPRFAWTGALSAAARAHYDAHGFVVLAAHAAACEVAALRAAADAAVRAPDAAPPDAAVFTTDDQARRMDDDWFLASAGAVRCFREERWREVKGGSGGDVEDANDRAVRMNKIGHAMHDLDSVFAGFSYGEGVRQVAAGLRLEAPAIVQSMYIMKQARIGAPVRPHRDGSFILSDNESCVGLWWPLGPATRANGCLWAVPGSHRDGVSRRLVRRAAGSDGCNATEFEGEEAVEYAPEDYVPLEMEAGDLVVLHGAVVHMSMDNESEASRHAYSIHFVDGIEAYSPRGWLQRPPELPFRRLDDPPLVANAASE